MLQGGSCLWVRGNLGGGRDLFLSEPNLAPDAKAGRRCSASLCNIIPQWCLHITRTLRTWALNPTQPSPACQWWLCAGERIWMAAVSMYGMDSNVRREMINAHRQGVMRATRVDVSETSHPLPTGWLWVIRITPNHPRAILTHQSGATAIDWSVNRPGHIALFRKPVSISRLLSAQSQVSDQ